MSLPSTWVITSPVSRRPCSAGLSLDGSVTKHTLGVVEADALGDVLGHVLDADTEEAAGHAARGDQLVGHLLHHRSGDGKSDTDIAAVREKMAVFTPTTSPFMLKSGPPELPVFTAASICRKSP